MIQKYHYSNTLPKINKYFLGFFPEKKLVDAFGEDKVYSQCYLRKKQVYAGISGYCENRPQFQKMLERARAG